MNFQRSRILTALTAALLILQGCGSNSAEEQGASQRPVLVKVEPVRRGDISTDIQVTGTVSPNRESFLGPRVSGRIETLYADEGDFVEKGAPLLQLEQVRFRLALEESSAAYEESAAQLKNLEMKLKRKEALFKKGVVNQEALDDIETETELARSRHAMAGSRMEKAREDYKDSMLLAPFSGFVVERRMNTGELFAGLSGNEYVFHLVDTARVRVEVNIFETKKRYINPGREVLMTVDAIPDKTFSGTITVVNPLMDKASRKFLAKIEIPNKDFALEAGMFARVRIPEEQRTHTLLVPAGAVIEREGRRLLFVARQQAAAERVVRTGLVTQDLIEILEGVEEGEPVIVDGLYAVKDGTPIRVRGT